MISFKCRVTFDHHDKTLHPHERERVEIVNFIAKDVFSAREFIIDNVLDVGEYIVSIHFLEHEPISRDIELRKLLDKLDDFRWELFDLCEQESKDKELASIYNNITKESDRLYQLIRNWEKA